METALTVVEMPTVGGDPLDYTHNDWVFSTYGGTNDLDPANIQYLLNQFYNVTDGSHGIIAHYLSPALKKGSNVCTLKTYDISGHLDGSPHGSPVDIRTMSLDGSDDAAWAPEGVCVCMSFHHAYGSDVEFGVHERPRARDRGRIYLGPLSVLAVEYDGTTHRARVISDLRALIAARCQYVVSEAEVKNATWRVWSRKNASARSVTDGWIDDRFDYQRRREDPGLVRTIWHEDLP